MTNSFTNYIKMQLLALAFLPAIITAAGIGSRQISSKDANGVLNKGESRGMGGFIEEVFRRSNVERECIEEQCGYEEWLEHAENDTHDIRKMAKMVTGPTASVRFSDYYIQCWEKVKTMKLDDPSLIDFRKACITTFLKETFPVMFMNETVDGEEGNHYDY